MTRFSDKLPQMCPLGCGGMTTTSICANCAERLEEHGITPPDPDATADEVRAWAASRGPKVQT